MKKVCFCSIIISLVCLLSMCPFVFNTQEKDNPPAYSKEYIEYLEAEDKSIYGDIIPEVYASPANDIEVASAIPTYYCLRDEYKIYTTYQDSYGLCWAYTCNTALETMIAKNYNEFYNFSAAWVGLTTKYYWDNHGYTDYSIGGGGNMSYYKYAVQNYGLMLQSNFDLRDFHSVDDENYLETYYLYDEYVIDSLGFDFETATYYNPSTSTIKSHILANGSLYAPVRSTDIVNKTSLCSLVGLQADHAVSIIGWDDSYKASSWKNAGAWIALNSWGDDWGNNGIFYISYDDVIANEAMYGFVPKDLGNDDVYIQLSSSSSNTENLIVNKYTSSANTTTGKFDKQLNIFEEGDDVSLEYSYVNADELKQIQINIYKNGDIVNSKFSNISYDMTKQVIYITTDADDTALLSLDDEDTLSAGTYEIEIEFIFDDSSQIVTKNLVIFDGLELDSILYYTDKTLQHASTKQVNFYTANYNSFNQENTYFEIFAEEYCYLRFYLGTYSKIVDYSYTVNSGLGINKSTANFSPYGTSYSKGYLYFVVYLKDSYSATSQATFTLQGESGKTKTYIFKIHNIKYYTNTFSTVYANVDYNGADENRIVPAEFAMTSGEKKYIATPIKEYSTFSGWYTSPNFESSSILPNDGTGYYLTTSIVNKNQGTNFYLDNFESSYGTDAGFSYIYLYAKWDVLKYSITYNWTDTNGLAQKEVREIDAKSNTNIAIKDISTVAEPGYEFIWESGYTNINFETGIINSLNQNIRIIGKYIPVAPILSAHTIDNEQTSNLSTTYTQNSVYTLKVEAFHLATNVTFDYTWKKKDDKGIFKKLYGETKNTISVSKASHSGEYICEVVAENSALGSSSKTATSTTFSITIKKAQTVIDTSSMIKEINYDGTIHQVTGAAINHSELSNSDIVYENNLIRDVGTGTQVVKVISKATENYAEAVVEVPVKINKAKVTIKIDNKRGAVFAEKQEYTYAVKFGTIFNNDDLMLEFKSGANIYLAGEYEISAVSKNANYEVEVINGTYSVYIEGLSLVLIIAGMIILISLVCLLVYFLLKKKANDRFLNANDFDDDIRF